MIHIVVPCVNILLFNMHSHNITTTLPIYKKQILHEII